MGKAHQVHLYIQPNQLWADSLFLRIKQLRFQASYMIRDSRCALTIRLSIFSVKVGEVTFFPENWVS
jgi:hypothetical protein